MDKNKVFIEKFNEKHRVKFPQSRDFGTEAHQQVISSKKQAKLS